MEDLVTTLRSIKILPVLTVRSVEEALGLVGALRDGGLKAVEITLRTPVALEALSHVKQAFPELIISAGTISNAKDVEIVTAIGVDFAVSPGLTPTILTSAKENNLTLLPGVATPSEVLLGMEWGLNCFKLFPAEAVGGIALLKALAAPLASISFCPTGGVNQNNLADYQALPNVVCVGGSWMVNQTALNSKDWPAISAAARTSMEHCTS